MDETEFLRKHLEFETPNADLICLDDDTGFITNLRNVVQVYVESCGARNERRIDHNPVVLRHIEVAG